MEVTGILVKQVAIREGVSSRNGNPWKIAEYLVEIPGQYPRHINFRVSDGQVGRLARFDSLIGKMVTVSFDIDAHEHEGRWFNEIGAWGIMEYITTDTRQANIAAAQGANIQQPTNSPQPQNNAPTGGENGEKGDDLPF
jgi:hypothetical protein